MPDDFPETTLTTGTVAVGGDAEGGIEAANDRDWFAVELEAGRTYRIDLVGSGTGAGVLRDPYLRGIHDADGNLIAGTGNDDGGRGYDSRVYFTPTEAGAYYVAAGAYGSATGAYTLSVVDVTGVFTDDFAAGTGTAGVLAAGHTPRAARGEVGHEDDRDWFAVELVAGLRYRIDLEGLSSGRGTLGDPYLYGVHDADGNLIAGTANDDRGRGYDSRVGFTPPTDGAYYVAVGAAGDGTGTYRLSIAGGDDYAEGIGTRGSMRVDGSENLAGTVRGEIETVDDRDWFAVELEAGWTYRVDVKGRSSGGGTLTNPATVIHDANGDFLVQTASGGVGLDARLTFVPTSSGAYYVEVSDDNFDVGTYRLSVRAIAPPDDWAESPGVGSGSLSNPYGTIEIPGDRDSFGTSLTAGTTYEFEVRGSDTGFGSDGRRLSLSDPYIHGIHDVDDDFIPGTTDNDSGRGNNSWVYFTPQVSDTYFLIVGGLESATGSYQVRQANLPGGVPDDYPAGTGTIAVAYGLEDVDDFSYSASGEIEVRSDRDWFQMHLVAGGTYRIDLEGRGRNPLPDPYIYGIHDGNGDRIPGTSNDDGGEGANSRVTFSPEETGTYYVAVGTTGRTAGGYRVSVRDLDESGGTGTAGVLEVGVPARGRIGSGADRDWFAVELEAGARYRIDLENWTPPTSGDGGLFDPHLYGIHDAGGDLIAGAADADSGDIRNSRVFFEPDATGTYYIVAGVGSGHTLTQGTYEVTVTDLGDRHAADYAAGIGTEGAVAANGSVWGEIGHAGDRDWFAVVLEAGETYQIDLVGSGEDPLRDPYLRGIHDADGDFIAGTRGGTVRGYSRVTFRPDEAGAYYVEVGATGGKAGTYRLEVVDGTPRTGRQETVNDLPAFAYASYAFDLAENADGGTVPVSLGLVQAADPEDGTVVYSIESGDPEGLFAIDPATGALSYRGAGEDYESGTTSYELTVRASDGAAHGDATVTVNVTDVEEQAVLEQTANEAPAFAYASYAFDLAENADGGTAPVSLGLVQAADPEDGTVVYSIEAGDPDGLFAIDAATGALSYRGAGEDYESGTRSYELTVRASDGALHGDATVTVNVTDVPEQTIVEPPDPENLQSVSEPAGEDLPTNTSTMGRVAVGGAATGDIDRPGDRDGFAVELVAGREYRIDLRGGPTGDGTLDDPYLRGIKGPDGRRIADVSDDDGGEGYNSRLSFTPTGSGAHYIIAGAYSDRRGTYELEVRDVSPQAARQETVNGSPAFGHASYAFALAENAAGDPVPVALGVVRATDPEDDPLAYSIASGDPGGLFAIDAATGALSYRGPGEDYESGTTSYDLTVRASDGGLHTDVDVTVHVTDVADADESVGLERGVSVSEPDGEDLPADASTTGAVAVGGSARGAVEHAYDRDWFAVELAAGSSYLIDLEGSPTGAGSLSDPYLRGIHDADGDLIANTTDDDGGEGRNSRLTFTPEEAGTYYVAAGAWGPGEGAYTLSVDEVM